MILIFNREEKKKTKKLMYLYLQLTKWMSFC